MRKSVSALAVASLATAGLCLASCSREEPELPGEPIVVRAAPPLPTGAAQPAPRAKAAAPSTVEDAPPKGVKVLASSNEDSGESPLTVQLEAQVREGSGTPPYTYLWDFGDGSPFGNASAVQHVYKIPGSYRASVIVTDKTGETDQDYADIDVERPDAEPPRVAPLTQGEALEILRRGQEAAQAAGKGKQ